MVGLYPLRNAGRFDHPCRNRTGGGQARAYRRSVSADLDRKENVVITLRVMRSRLSAAIRAPSQGFETEANSIRATTQFAIDRVNRHNASVKSSRVGQS